MSNEPSEQINCASCGQGYPWSAELADKQVRCQCGHVFAFPPACPTQSRPPELTDPFDMSAPSHSPDLTKPSEAPIPLQSGDEYEVPAHEPAHGGRCPSCGQEINVHAVICIKCGFNIQAGAKMSTAIGSAAPDALARETADAGFAKQSSFARHAIEQAQKNALARAAAERDYEAQHRFTEFHLPLILAGVGVFLILLNAFALPSINRTERHFKAVSKLTGAQVPTKIVLRFFELGKSVFQVCIQLPFVFIGMLFVAKVFGTTFGDLVPALLKLIAVALILVGMGDCLYSMFEWMAQSMELIGLLLVFAFDLCAFFYLVIWLYRLDIMETLVLWLSSFFFPKLVAGFIFMAIVAALM